MSTPTPDDSTPATGDKRKHGQITPDPQTTQPAPSLPTPAAPTAPAPAPPAPPVTPAPPGPNHAGEGQGEGGEIDVDMPDTPDTTPEGLAPNPPLHTLLPVPLPEEGFPPIHGLTEKDFFAHVHADTLKAWRDQPGPYIFAYLANDKIVKEATSRVNRIRELITSFFDCPELVVGAAKPANFRHLDYKPVFPFFIGGLTPYQADRLIERTCWSTPNITVFFVPPKIPLSPFIMTLGNLPLAPTPANNRKVADTVKAKIISSRNLCGFIQRNRNNVPASLDGASAIQYIADSVRVASFHIRERGDDIPVFNVYITSPTTKPDNNILWAHKLRALNYTCLEGTGEARELFHCNDCKGRDHPSGLCPYKDIPGWHPNDRLTAADERDEDGARHRDTGSRGARGSRGGTPRGRGRRGTVRGRATRT